MNKLQKALDELHEITTLISWDPGVSVKPAVDQWYCRLNNLKTKLDAELVKVRYKPGYRFKTVMYDANQLYLIIEVDTADTDDPKNMFHLEFATYLDERVIIIMLQDPGVFRRIVYQHVMDMEKHEVGEWLRFGEARPWHPHAPDPTKQYLDRPKDKQ